MKTFDVINGNETVKVQIPSSMADFSKEEFLSLTKNLIIAPNHSIVALVYHEKLSTVIMTYKQRRKDVTAKVVTLFIKSGHNENNPMIDAAETKDILIISPTALNVAQHIYIKSNPYNLDKFCAKLENDNSAYKRASENNFEAYFVDFKIIPNYEIRAVAKNDGLDNPRKEGNA